MGIYRGAGGSGDAVNDASSEALITIQAKDAALAAQAAAEAAQVAAELAETNAETAETNAETAETNAETAATNAAASASAASTSASNAATSATNAANSATAAQTAETNAETAETNAAASASAASTSASNAATSATNAANSESSASTSATNASNSASAAATSATNAAASATSAAGSASTATTQATNAANSATAAATSASNAASSATSASNSASTATTQATNAANSASAAATSATNAANSASAAATSATNAANSATSAASSATAAAASYDSFDDRYLGAKSSAPTLDNDGNALVNGALYFDSTLAAMRVYNTATATWATIQQGITNTDPVRHSVRPSLLLDFANTKTLDPRITFTRGSTGTYYDGKTVAKAEENLLQQSQVFDQSPWFISDATITANAVSAPDGTTTAEALLETVANNAHYVAQTITLSAVAYTFSCFIKANGRNYAFISHAGTNVVSVNLSAGTATSATGSPSNITCVETPTGSGWYRVGFTFTPSAGSTNVRVWASTDGDWANRNYSGDITKGLYVWGAQLEQRSSVTAYTPTTTAPITNYIPALQTAASGVARFEHNPVTGESLGLEIEEQRTNLLLRSEELGTTWTTTRLSVSTNTLVAPDGTLTADKLVEDTTASNTHTLQQSSVTVANSTVYTISFFAKAGERTWVACQASGAWTGGQSVYFGLTGSGSVGTIVGTGTATITLVGNGWYRCTFTPPATTSTTAQIILYLANANGGAVYTGDGWSGAYFWGAQLEAGSFATSYIKTEGSQVTRSADSASMTGTNFSSWFRQGEGTLYTETSNANQNPWSVPATLEGRLSSNRAYIRQTSATSVSAIVDQAASNAFTISGSGYKAALAFRVGSMAFTVNGQTPSAPTLSSINGDYIQLNIGNFTTSFYQNGSIKKIAYYPARLTNAELQGLTTV